MDEHVEIPIQDDSLEQDPKQENDSPPQET